jgi:hypothetical protein
MAIPSRNQYQRDMQFSSSIPALTDQQLSVRLEIADATQFSLSQDVLSFLTRIY